MKLNEMRILLESKGIQLTKSLGQNFLHDENQLRRIVDAAQLTHSDQVLEVGPGLGPLTEWLVAYVTSVMAIEVDHRLCEVLRERFIAIKNLTLIHADALDYFKDRPRDWRNWKLVANLPYSVASPILVELALSGQGPMRMVVTLQREVAQRLVAKADTDEYGLLTLLVQLDYEGRIAFRIPSGCFFPEPGVESACAVMQRRARPLLSDPDRKVFVRLVRQSFSQRRKKMSKLLKPEWPEEVLLRLMGDCGLDPDVRAEKVTLEQFVALAGRLSEWRMSQGVN